LSLLKAFLGSLISSLRTHHDLAVENLALRPSVVCIIGTRGALRDHDSLHRRKTTGGGLPPDGGTHYTPPLTATVGSGVAA